MIENKNILYGIGLGQDNEKIIKYLKKDDDEKYKNKNISYIYGNVKSNKNALENNSFENIGNNYNNGLLYSNSKGINYNLFNMNFYGINYFNSNLLYYDSIKNVLKRY